MPPSQGDEEEQHTDSFSTPSPGFLNTFADTQAPFVSGNVGIQAFPGPHASEQRSAIVTREIANPKTQAASSFPVHLTPLSIEQYQVHLETTSGHPELVDGLVVNLGDMPNEIHHRMQKCWVYCFHVVHRKKGADLLVYSEAEMRIKSLRDALKLVQKRESEWLSEIGGSSSSQASQSTDSEGSSPSREKRATIRLPDVAVGEYFSAKKNLSPRSKKMVFHSDRLPLVAVEVTSPTTRHVDLYFKWEEYARCGVEEYYVVDREKDCIIRGYFSEHEPRYPNGDPDFELPSNRSCKQTPKLPSFSYCRQIFRGVDRVAGRFFDLLDDDDADLVKAKNLLRPVHAEDIMRKEEEKYTRELEDVKQELKKSEAELKETKEKVKDRDITIKRLREDLEASKKHRVSSRVRKLKDLKGQKHETSSRRSGSDSRSSRSPTAASPNQKASNSNSGSPTRKRPKK